jgi:tetratricopeptide (TPR) repeat protein
MSSRAHEPPRLPDGFWARQDVLQSLAERDVGRLFRLIGKYAGASQSQIAIAVKMTQGQVSTIMSGTRRVSVIEVAERLFDGLDAPDPARIAFGLAPRTPPAVASDAQRPSNEMPADLDDVEALRQGLNDTLGAGAMSEATLEDWERTVVRYGRATRDRPAGVLLADLAADLAELRQALTRCRSASGLRTLTRVAAHMAGLMCLTLCKLDDRSAFRQWARTARLAAREAGDPATQSWILAQEAYGHYYSGDLLEAVEVARQAQELVNTSPCVGAALAAALESRAQAAMGRDLETREALARAESILSRLDGDSLIASAFGYNEAQLRFHEGNAYTHLRDVRSALAAQDRALELCAPGDYTDWAMTRLDRATCLVYDGDVSEGLAYATHTLANLTEPQRQGIISLRGSEILQALPADPKALPAARDFRDLLVVAPEKG